MAASGSRSAGDQIEKYGSWATSGTAGGRSVTATPEGAPFGTAAACGAGRDGWAETALTAQADELKGDYWADAGFAPF